MQNSSKTHDLQGDVPVQTLTDPVPPFCPKHILNPLPAFSGIGPAEPVWRSRLQLAPALNLSTEDRKDLWGHDYKLVYPAPSLKRNSSRHKIEFNVSLNATSMNSYGTMWKRLVPAHRPTYSAIKINTLDLSRTCTEILGYSVASMAGMSLASFMGK